MIESTRRNYNQEFKIEAVKLIEEEKYSLKEASIRFGIAKSTISKWKALYGHNNGSVLSNRSWINSF
jgi:transposase